MSLYIEILMQTEMEKLWGYTQSPELHARWEQEQQAYLALWNKNYSLPPHEQIPAWTKPL